MDWASLPALLAVARTGSLAAAARQLKINSTTVGRRIDALEKATGSKLIETDREGSRLTAAGESVLSSIEQMEGFAFDVERKLVGRDAALSGRLRVSTTDTLAHYEPALFSSFVEEFEHVELEVVTSYRELSLAQRETDIALRWTNQPSETLFGRKLVRAEYALYGEEKLVQQVGCRASLEKFPWLAWSQSSGARITERWMKSHVPGARIVSRFDSALAMHGGLRAGAGVAFLPCAFGDQLPHVVRLRSIQPDFAYEVWGLTHPELARTARVRAFLSHAGSYFEKAKKRYAGKSPREIQPSEHEG